MTWTFSCVLVRGHELERGDDVARAARARAVEHLQADQPHARRDALERRRSTATPLPPIRPATCVPWP